MSKAKQDSAVHVYSVLTYYGLVPFIIASGSTKLKYAKYKYNTPGVRKDEYLDILSNHLIPQIRSIFDPRGIKFIFQQDGAPPHTAKSTQSWLKA